MLSCVSCALDLSGRLTERETERSEHTIAVAWWWPAAAAAADWPAALCGAEGAIVCNVWYMMFACVYVLCVSASARCQVFCVLMLHTEKRARVLAFGVHVFCVHVMHV